MKKASVVKSKFIREIGLGEPNTKLWETYDEVIKSKISSVISLIPDEEVVVIFYLDEDYWWLITNARFILFENKGIIYVDTIVSMENQLVTYLRDSNQYEGFRIELKGEEGKRRFLKQDKEILLLTLENNEQIDLKFDSKLSGCIMKTLRFIFS